jgi:hypothetical protein
MMPFPLQHNFWKNLQPIHTTDIFHGMMNQLLKKILMRLQKLKDRSLVVKVLNSRMF